MTEPLALPDAAGAKVTLMVVLWPAVSVRGVVIEPIVKPVPLIATVVPPSAGPELGETASIVGRGPLGT